jgi:hypothetical protein
VELALAEAKEFLLEAADSELPDASCSVFCYLCFLL